MPVLQHRRSVFCGHWQAILPKARARVVLLDEAIIRKQGAAAVRASWNRARPNMLVLSRYGGGGHEPAVWAARADNIPVIYHIDDDLFSVPEELGPEKFGRYK